MKGALPALQQLLSDAEFNAAGIEILDVSFEEGGPDDTIWSSVSTIMQAAAPLHLNAFCQASHLSLPHAHGLACLHACTHVPTHIRR